MSTTSLPRIPQSADLERVKITMNQLLDELDWLLGGFVDSKNIRELTANKIKTGTLDAGLVTVRANYAGGSFIELSANGIRINDGTNDTFTADTAGHVTMTGAQIQSSAAAYPRVEMSSSSNLFKASGSATNNVTIEADNGGGSPGLFFNDSVNGNASILNTSTDFLIATPGSKRTKVSSGSDLFLAAASNVDLQPAGSLKINGSTGYTGTFAAGVSGALTVTVKKGIITSVV